MLNPNQLPEADPDQTDDTPPTPKVRIRKRVRLPQTDTAAVMLPEDPTPGSVDYEVGYCRPPKETRFKKGRSGNPKGRPPGARNLRTIAREVLDRKLEVRIDGKRKKLPVRELMIRQQSKRAVEKEDLKAAAFVLQLAGELSGGSVVDVAHQAETQGGPELDPTELAMLAFKAKADLMAKGLTEEHAQAALAILGLAGPEA
jgi:hypothetical protein